MGSSLSLAEELSTYFAPGAPPQQQQGHATPATTSLTSSTVDSSVSSEGASNKEPFQGLPVLAAIALPLGAALTWGSQEGGLTDALSLAGSFGSPLLYGVLPAVMALQQRRQRAEPQEGRFRPANQETVPDGLVPGYSLPLLGGLATAFVGQEMLTRAGEFMAMAT